MHRLEVASCKRTIFSPFALQSIFEFSGGIPRVINQICDLSMFLGFSKQVDIIEQEIVKEAGDILEGK